MRSACASCAINSLDDLASKSIDRREHALAHGVLDVTEHLRQLLSVGTPVQPSFPVDLHIRLQIDHLFLQFLDLDQQLAVFILCVGKLLLEALSFLLHLLVPLFLHLLHAVDSVVHFFDELVLSPDDSLLLPGSFL